MAPANLAALFLTLAIVISATDAAMQQFINVSSVHRPLFVVDFDMAIFICQNSSDPMDLKIHKIAALCDGKMDCLESISMSDEMFPYCSNSSMCHPACTEEGACLNVGGRSQCYCNNGYGGKGCEVEDANECTDKPCHWLARCTNTLGSYYCSCMPGFAGDGNENCTDIDECENSSISGRCPANSKCCNLPGSYFCNCTAGYTPIGSPVQECVDIDECDTKEAECPIGTECINTKGGYKCTPSFSIDCQEGYEADGDKCVDIDECKLEIDDCDPRAKCTNLPGTFTCVCDEEFHGDGKFCEPLTDCSRNEKVCSENAFCIATLKQCFCESGFNGNGIVCEDIDECLEAEYPCKSNEKCLNTKGSHLCCDKDSSPGECKQSLVKSTCTPKCGPNASCVDGKCRCDTAMSGNPYEGCRKIDCKMETGVCGTRAKCLEMGGTCICLRGYKEMQLANGPSCVDVDECVEYEPCDRTESCINTAGSFKCCEPGSSDLECKGPRRNTALLFDAETTRSPESVQPLIQTTPQPTFGPTDSCISDQGCGLNSFCDFAAGICRCNAGFIGGPPAKPCIDADECAFKLHDCDSTELCLNYVGGYRCLCEPGFMRVGKQCVDVNECKRQPCGEEAVCDNSPGSFECTCRTGYSGDGYICGPQELEPCTTHEQRNQCGENMRCYAPPSKSLPSSSSSIDGIQCRCKTGYKFDSGRCTDINECLGDNRCDDNADCANLAGSYTCRCKSGFMGDGFYCQDINECINDPCHPYASCLNVQGSSICSCKDGYTGDGYRCEPINMDSICSKGEVCHHNAFCIDLDDGSNTCKCRNGYRGNGAGCSDINECAEGRSTCDPDTSACINKQGSYDCRCKTGFEGAGGFCTDVDECSLLHPCNENAHCVNNVGTFTCECNEGFTGDGILCVDVDDSACPLPSLADCNSHNMTCIINSKDEPECFQCKPGFSGPKHQCEDIDECAPGSTSCSEHAECKNEPGGFLCGPCKSGYIGDGFTCVTDGDTVVKDCENPSLNDCSENGDCFDKAGGGHLCMCKDGFLGDGKNCDDIDECFGSGVCGENALCTNNPGSYECACKEGYSGNPNHICKSVCPGEAKPLLNVGSCQADLNQCPTGYICHNTNCCPDPSETNCAFNASACHPEAYCQSGNCRCNIGFEGNGVKCDDLNECEVRQPCHKQHLCLNTVGSYRCCKSTDSSSPCRNAWDCDSNPDACSTNAACVSGRCQCKSGYKGNGHYCISDADADCVENIRVCSSYASCDASTQQCICDSGYVGDGVQCDVDLSDVQVTGVSAISNVTTAIPTTLSGDCVSDASICHTNALCERSSRSCRCRLGFLGDGVNKCDPDPEDCYLDIRLCKGNTRCVNRRCRCREGFEGDPTKECTLADINNCVVDPSVCHRDFAKCNPTVQHCECIDGYIGNGQICNPDPTDCGKGSAICHRNAACKSDRQCHCLDGYSGDGIRMCVKDPDDCQVNPSICDSQATCIRQTVGEGSTVKAVHRCRCNAGYQGTGQSCQVRDIGTTTDRSTTTINPCSSRNLNDCAAQAICTALRTGGWTCHCKPGYEGDGQKCSRDFTDLVEGSRELDVECEGDGIALIYRSNQPFTGRIFVKSQSQNPYCSQEYTNIEGPAYYFKAPFDHCDLKKEPKNTFSVVVIIQKHPLFITSAADAYNLKCTYPTGEKTVGSHFNVSMLTTSAVFTKNAPMGQCLLQVLNPSTAELQQSALIGQLLQLRLSVNPGDLYGVFAKNCIAVNMDDGDTYALTDTKGCSVDKTIFPTWENLNDSTIFANFMSFKWPDTTSIRFQCDCVICYDKCPPVKCDLDSLELGRKKRHSAINNQLLLQRLVRSTNATRKSRTVPVYSSVLVVQEDGNKAGAKTVQYDSEDASRDAVPLAPHQPIESIEAREQQDGSWIETTEIVRKLTHDDEVCVPTAVFALTLTIAVLFGLTVLTCGIVMSYRSSRKKDQKAESFGPFKPMIYGIPNSPSMMGTQSPHYQMSIGSHR